MVEEEKPERERQTMKVSVILGTRPQIIKSAPVLKAMRKSGFDCSMINTGQHYDYEMNRKFFSELGLPDAEADLGVGRGRPNEQISAVVSGLERYFARQRPDLALIPGDTNSALAAGIACSKAGVRIIHLESGCRSNDFHMSEEVNRRVVDHISQVLLCPTVDCVENVRSEKVLAEVVENVGDTMLDSLIEYRDAIEKSDALGKIGLEEGEYAFMTLHRAENVDEPLALASILDGVESLGLPIVFSVHPHTKTSIHIFGSSIPRNVKLISPLPYIDTLALVNRSAFVVTDSGGLQKEAFWLGKHSLVTREYTEWNEIVRARGTFLVGSRKAKMMEGYKKIQRAGGKAFVKSKKIFGDGHASEKVVEVLADEIEELEEIVV